MALTQHRYVALLRGVNVGGKTIIKMADLRYRFESFGLADVATYIQSGNVLFTSGEADTERLANELEKKLEASLGHRGKVFVLSPAQLQEAADNNPFDPQSLDQEQRCQLLFLSREPDAVHREELMGLQGEEYRFAIRGKVLYYAYPRAFEGRRRTLNFEKVLGVTGTARNWKVVAKLIELAR